MVSRICIIFIFHASFDSYAAINKVLLVRERDFLYIAHYYYARREYENVL